MNALSAYRLICDWSMRQRSAWANLRGQRKRGNGMRTLTVSRLLVVIALVLFLLAAFHVGLGAVDLIALGLAVYMASLIVP